MLLRRRLLLLFVAIIAGVLALGGFTAILIRDRDHAQERERQLSISLERVARLGTAYTDQETGQRGYALTGEAGFLEPFTGGRARAAELTRDLQTELDTPGPRSQLKTVIGAAAKWRGQADKEILLRNASGASAAIAEITKGTSTTLFDRVRSSLASLGTKLQIEADRATSHLDNIGVALSALFVTIAAVALIGAIVAALLIRRWITRPIDRLAGEVRRVQAGALDSAIEIEGPPELASLALDIDAMRGRIRQQLVDSERSRLAVEQSAAVVLTLRSELEPDVGPIPDGWSVAGKLRAADGVVAGDCYDIFVTKDGQIAVVVVDIAGHGATEGILALRCKEMLRTSLTSGSAPGVALDTTAEILGNMGAEVFLTAFVAVINTDDGRVRYANAGHPPAYIVGPHGETPLEPTGPLVGLLTPGWTTAEAVMAHGDNLCAYTDGVLESRNRAGMFFGSTRLVGILIGARSDSAPAVVKRCVDEVELFSPGGLRDDATIVVLCRAE
jgi:serine phosphatase RsbU (regulator of sigma subunit)/CHASE3 domain sensor protein